MKTGNIRSCWNCKMIWRHQGSQDDKENLMNQQKQGNQKNLMNQENLET